MMPIILDRCCALVLANDVGVSARTVIGSENMLVGAASLLFVIGTLVWRHGADNCGQRRACTVLKEAKYVFIDGEYVAPLALAYGRNLTPEKSEHQNVDSTAAVRVPPCVTTGSPTAASVEPTFLEKKLNPVFCCSKTRGGRESFCLASSDSLVCSLYQSEVSESICSSRSRQRRFHCHYSLLSVNFAKPIGTWFDF